MRIKVQILSGRTLQFKCHASDAIESVLDAHHFRSNVAVMAPLQGNRPLSDYHIQNGSTLFQVKTSLSLQIKPQEGRRFDLDVQASDTIGRVKQMIKPKTANENLPSGIPPQLQRLRFDGKDLPNESKISDHSILHQSMLSLRWSNLDMESHMDGLTANE